MKNCNYLVKIINKTQKYLEYIVRIDNFIVATKDEIRFKNKPDLRVFYFPQNNNKKKSFLFIYVDPIDSWIVLKRHS